MKNPISLVLVVLKLLLVIGLTSAVVRADDPPGCGYWESREVVVAEFWGDLGTGKWVDVVVGSHWEETWVEEGVWIEWAAGGGEWTLGMVLRQTLVYDTEQTWLEDYGWIQVKEFRDFWVSLPC